MSTPIRSSPIMSVMPRIDADEYRILLARHGFELVDQVIEDAQAGGRTVWLARCG
jgi:hypothetical protein